MDAFRSFVYELYIMVKFIYLSAKQLFQEACRTVKPLNDPINRREEYAIITGGNRGLGFYTLLGLQASGMKVIAGCRDGRSKQQLFENLEEAGIPADSVEWINLDLSSLNSIRNFAKVVTDRNIPISLLINNAAVMFTPYGLTTDGLEQQFAVNYLGHFLLTHLLLPRLIEAGKHHRYASRIVNVASDVSYLGYLELNDLNAKSFYNRFVAYSQSKLAQVLFNEMLHDRLTQNNYPVKCYAMHPGVIQSNWYANGRFLKIGFRIVGFLLKREPVAAQRVLYTAFSPELENSSGCYLSDCKITTPATKSICPSMRLKLWDATHKLLDIEEFGKVKSSQ
ncbi:short-chain dehydrogenase TIC 32 B, chloroplastic-like [Daphnia pulex]|uniref:short-chain dehydrogenase TIC 32 B, chloroplastic-like n=1 Tax=Daphnia pulex TaxID=6669 RepID=UPI001EDF5CD3|nr:short-chain dehydrogenase TIC 32 B, chloroplastic-like [Daphnia pulex]